MALHARLRTGNPITPSTLTCPPITDLLLLPNRILERNASAVWSCTPDQLIASNFVPCTASPRLPHALIPLLSCLKLS